MTATGTVLVIDDNDAVRVALDVLLSLDGVRVIGADSPEAGLRELERGEVDLVIQDMNFRRDTTSGEEGVELFHRLHALDPDLPIVLMTAWTHLETAVGLVRAGAADYVAKPWDDARLRTTVRNLLELRRQTIARQTIDSRRAAARDELRRRYALGDAIYESDAMHEALTLATRVARADVPVLVTGPNGAGKEVVADVIEANSGRHGRPFIKVNCGALPAELVESELFGAEAGAFTGAMRAREGRFEAADGGTLFLDEIGNLPAGGQAKLLRVLQTGEFERLGSSQTRKVSVRVISATNADLKAAIRDGRFREDLFYRLNVIEIRVPALAARRDDVLPLARHFLEPGYTLDPSAERALLAHGWPGNVRELANVIRRACLLTEGTVITVVSLGLADATPLRSGIDEPDRAAIESALDRAGGVVARAARELGLSRQALYRRMERVGLREPDERPPAARAARD